LSEISVIKTIRLHLSGVSKLIQHHRNIKIIHLIRDPRHQLESRLKLKKSFRCEKDDVASYCEAYLEDLKLGSDMKTDMYRLVRYEDIVADPISVMSSLYDFVGINMTKSIAKQINDHFNAENLKNAKVSPMSTYRRSKYINHTSLSLPSELRAEVEEKCGDVLKFGGYD